MLFGTDGVRGVANRDLTPDLVFRLGRALGRVLGGGPSRTVAVGRDSRLSGDLLEAALTAGILSEGVDVHPLGVIPTPGVAYATRKGGFDAGAMISASHNPVEDNGVKFFTAEGFKLTDAEEEEIEAAMGQSSEAGPTGAGVGRLKPREGGLELYRDFLRSVPEGVLNRTVIADAAFGSAAAMLPAAFAGAVKELVVLHGEVDGGRINVGCGSTHPHKLKEAVRSRGGGAIGVAFDGDADRMVAVDEAGELVDGDHMIGMLAPWFRERGWLGEEKVALTVLSNVGLKEALERRGIGVVETPVGDRHLIAAMRREGLALGAEPSGHLVAAPFNTTGDGLLSALLLFAYLGETGATLRDAKGTFTPYPLLQENVEAHLKEAVASHPRVTERLGAWEERMQGKGRLLIRPSGTEPLVRVMVEAPDLKFCREVLEDVVACVRAAAEEVRPEDPGPVVQ